MLDPVLVSRTLPKPPPPTRGKKQRASPAKRKRGGQRGNSNARTHGLYSSKKPHPKTLLFKVSAPKVKLSELGECDTGQVEIFRHALDSNRGLLDKLALLADNATSPDEMLAWDRQIIRIIKRDLKLIQAIHYLEKPKKDLLELARSAHYFVQWEFEERGIPEHSIFVPLGYDNFCAHPDSSLERFRDNTIEAPTTNPLFVPPVLINFRANLPDSTMLSPFLTDQQWLLIRDSFTSLREDVEFFRKYKRRKPRFSPRLLFEAILIKLACDLRWEDLSHIIYTFHPDLASFPLRECQRLYRDLFNSGRLQAIYKQLHWHLDVYGETTLEDLVGQGCFQLGKNGVALTSGQSLTWQLFTALLLLQRAYHNQRASQREKDAERRRDDCYYRFPSPRPQRAKRSSDSSASIEQPSLYHPPIPEPVTFEPLETSPAFKKWKQIESFNREVAIRRVSVKRTSPISATRVAERQGGHKRTSPMLATRVAERQGGNKPPSPTSATRVVDADLFKHPPVQDSPEED